MLSIVFHGCAIFQCLFLLQLRTNFIHPGRDQGLFFGAGECLDLRFSPPRGTAGMAVLPVDNLYRPATSKVPGSTSRGMLDEAAFEIGCDAGIKRVIRTEDHIYQPIHLPAASRTHVLAAATVFIRGMSAGSRASIRSFPSSSRALRIRSASVTSAATSTHWHRSATRRKYPAPPFSRLTAPPKFPLRQW